MQLGYLSEVIPRRPFAAGDKIRARVVFAEDHDRYALSEACCPTGDPSHPMIDAEFRTLAGIEAADRIKSPYGIGRSGVGSIAHREPLGT